jgi:hypothetical protein
LVSSKQATVGFSPFPGWHPAALITPQEFLMLFYEKQEACRMRRSGDAAVKKKKAPTGELGYAQGHGFFSRECRSRV